MRLLLLLLCDADSDGDSNDDNTATRNAVNAVLLKVFNSRALIWTKNVQNMLPEVCKTPCNLKHKNKSNNVHFFFLCNVDLYTAVYRVNGIIRLEGLESSGASISQRHIIAVVHV